MPYRSSLTTLIRSSDIGPRACRCYTSGSRAQGGGALFRPPPKAICVAYTVLRKTERIFVCCSPRVAFTANYLRPWNVLRATRTSSLPWPRSLGRDRPSVGFTYNDALHFVAIRLGNATKTSASLKKMIRLHELHPEILARPETKSGYVPDAKHRMYAGRINQRQVYAKLHLHSIGAAFLIHSSSPKPIVSSVPPA